MKPIERHIAYLLTRHDCVIVPGWGAFVANYEPAHIDTAAGVIYPPSRSVAFNPVLNHNDGLLAASIARGSCITYDQAVDRVNASVKEMHSTLQSQGHLMLDQLGTFLLQGDGITPLFTPANSPLTNASGFALRPVAAPALPHNQINSPISQSGNMTPIRITPMRWLSDVGRIAASVALLIGMGVLLTTPITVDRDIDRASINPITTITAPKAATAPAVAITAVTQAPAPKAALQATAKEAPKEIREETPQATADEAPQATAQAKVREATKEQSEPQRRILADDPYCLIVASLPTRSEAERYLSRAADKQLQILEKDGKFRIYAATGRTVAQAQAHISNGSLAHNYPGAWVCHR